MTWPGDDYWVVGRAFTGFYAEFRHVALYREVRSLLEKFADKDESDKGVTAVREVGKNWGVSGERPPYPLTVDGRYIEMNEAFSVVVDIDHLLANLTTDMCQFVYNHCLGANARVCCF